VGGGLGGERKPMAHVAPLDPDEQFEIPDPTEEEWQTFDGGLRKTGEQSVPIKKRRGFGRGRTLDRLFRPM
jgi:hypothetical protein